MSRGSKILGELIAGMILVVLLISAWGLIGVVWRWASSVWFG